MEFKLISIVIGTQTDVQTEINYTLPKLREGNYQMLSFQWFES